jgi:hypothetical protein
MTDAPLQQITRPVIAGTDGHASREDTAVQAFCIQARIRQHIEPGQTSDAFQMLDKVSPLPCAGQALRPTLPPAGQALRLAPRGNSVINDSPRPRR